jgi:hypothetical protein
MVLQYINDPNILGYRVRVADNLDNAYGPANGVGGAGTFALTALDVSRGANRVTKPIRLRRTAITGDTTRGQTRITFDPNEFFGASPVVPPDSGLWFIRTQIRTVASPAFPIGADNTNQSIIDVVQDPEFFSVPRPAVTLYGTAPAIGAVPGLPAPPQAMIFGVPAFADAMVVTNHGASPLFFGAALDQPLMQVDAGRSISHASGMKDETVICAGGATTVFSVLFSTVTGMR